MSSEPNATSTPQPGDEPLTPYQEAIRARAIATLENDERQPKPSTRRKILTAVAALVMLLFLGFVIDFGVRIVQRILELYMQDDTSVQAPVSSPDQPYFITVDPLADAPPAETSSSSSAMSAP